MTGATSIFAIGEAIKSAGGLSMSPLLATGNVVYPRSGLASKSLLCHSIFGHRMRTKARRRPLTAFIATGSKVRQLLHFA